MDITNQNKTERRSGRRRARDRRGAVGDPVPRDRRALKRRRVPSRRTEDFVSERRSGMDRRTGSASGPHGERERREGPDRRDQPPRYYLPGVVVTVLP